MIYTEVHYKDQVNIRSCLGYIYIHVYNLYFLTKNSTIEPAVLLINSFAGYDNF